MRITATVYALRFGPAAPTGDEDVTVCFIDMYGRQLDYIVPFREAKHFRNGERYEVEFKRVGEVDG